MPFIVLLILDTSCKKDKNDENCNLSSTSIVGSYKITGFTIQQVGGEPKNAFDQIETCAKDDIITFKSNYSYSINESGTICTNPFPN